MEKDNSSDFLGLSPGKGRGLFLAPSARFQQGMILAIFLFAVFCFLLVFNSSGGSEVSKASDGRVGAEVLNSGDDNVGADGQAGSWLAGVGAVDISPEQHHLAEGLYMGGYGIGKERGPAEGVKEKIWARAMALSDGETTVVILSLDLPGISCSDISKIRGLAVEVAGSGTGMEAFSENDSVDETLAGNGYDPAFVPGARIVPQNIIVSVTHTHSGPDLQGLWGGVPDSYRKWLREKAAAAVVQSLADLQPVRLYRGTAAHPDGIRNRRDSEELLADLYLLYAKTPEDKMLASLVVYGVHTTFIGEENKKVSPDFCGELIGILENKWGGTALFVPGTQGDQVPVKNGMTSDDYAREIAGAASAAFSNSVEISGEEPGNKLYYDNAVFPLKVRNPVFLLAYLFRYLSHYETGFNLTSGLHIMSEVSYLSIGDAFSMVTVPGEILSKAALELHSLSPTPAPVILGLSNGTLGYFVQEDDWNGGIPFLNRGYEESVSMGRHAWPTVRDKLLDMQQ